MGCRTFVAGALVVVSTVAAGCSSDGEEAALTTAEAATTSSSSAPPLAAGTVAPGSVPSASDSVAAASDTGPTSSIESAYSWSPLAIGAGGFVTGVVAVADADGNLRLSARTDVAGAYRWRPDDGRWEQMLTADALDAAGPLPGDSSVASLAVAPSNPDVMYAAVGADFDPAPGEAVTGEGRVLRSDDGGETWRTSLPRWFVSGNQQFRTGTERLAVDPDDPDHVVFGTQREGLWTSRDGGRTWTQVSLDAVPAGLGNGGEGDQAGVNMVAFVPTASGHLLMAGVAGHAVLVSNDDGETWQQIHNLNDGDVPSGAAVSGSTATFAVIRVDGGDGSLLRFDAGTGLLDQIDTPANRSRWNVAVDPANDQRLILTDDAVRDDHLWTSADGGTTWTGHDIDVVSPEIPWLAETDLDGYMTAGAFAFDPTVPGRVWFAEGMGMWHTDDIDAETVTWTSASVGMEITVVSGITALSGGDVIVTVADRQGFLIDATGGYPERTLIDSRFASGSSLDVSASDPAVMAWVGAESNDPGSPDREVRGAVSSDGGESWQEMTGTRYDMYGGEVAVSATDPQVIAWLPSNPTDAFASEPAAGVYVSQDSGRSWAWHALDAGANSFHRLFWWFTRRAMAADEVNGDFYLLSDSGPMFVGTDGGTTWTRAANAPPCSIDDDCHVHGQLQAVPGEAGHLWASVGTAGLYRTDDAGATPWVRVPGVDEAQEFAFGAALPGGKGPAVYLYGRVDGDPEFGLWRSADAGESWELIARHPGNLPTELTVVSADPDVAGRVYVGFNGSGAVRGDAGVE